MGNQAGGAAVMDLNVYETDVIANVDRFGCHITSVFDPDHGLPDFSYSTGFPKSLDQPEVIIFGLQRKLMASMINEIYRQCAEDGLELADGLVVSDLLLGHDCIAREVSADALADEFFTTATWYSHRILGRELRRGFQIFWPGAESGLYPWDEGAHPDICESQPSLYEWEKA